MPTGHVEMTKFSLDQRTNEATLTLAEDRIAGILVGVPQSLVRIC